MDNLHLRYDINNNTGKNIPEDTRHSDNNEGLLKYSLQQKLNYSHLQAIKKITELTMLPLLQLYIYLNSF